MGSLIFFIFTCHHQQRAISPSALIYHTSNDQLASPPDLHSREGETNPGTRNVEKGGRHLQKLFWRADAHG